MAEVNYKPNKYTDSVSSFEGGMQSGVSPLVLPKNQIGVGVNCSLRGGFIHPRPAFQKKTLNFNNNAALQTLVTAGLFQAAGYYRPDFGTESLIASIAGHLIQFQESGLGGQWNVNDVSIANNLSSSSQPQGWMWQAEKWLIFNDGSGALPIFFDGTTSRRSYGPTQVLGSVTAASPSSPPSLYVPTAIPPLNGNPTGTSNMQANAAVLVTLAAPYTGPFNVPVIFNGEYYQVSPVNFGNGTNIQLTNVNDTPAGTEPVGTTISVQSNLLALSNTGGTLTQPVPGEGWNANLVLNVTGTAGMTVGQKVNIYYTIFYVGGGSGINTFSAFTVTSVNRSTNVLKATFAFGSNVASMTIAVGAQITTTSAGTVVNLGTLQDAFIVPALGSTVNALLSQPYTGASGQLCFVGTALYQISSFTPTPVPNQITLINLTDASANPYSLPLAINSVPELPAGRMGCYGMGRNWFSLTNGTNYEAGDIVGGGSGTPAFNYRDAVLKTTENDFLTGGGTFSLPGTGDIITAMIFPPVLDTSLGVGSLQIFTPFSVFANNAPADRTTWINLTWPIQTESLKDQGALAQDSTVLVNSDVFFRSDFNLCSLVLARRQFEGNQWGNKPISNEMQRFLQLDNPALLNYGSGTSFDNRFMGTCSPVQSSNGVFHQGLTMLNFDLMSSLRTDLPSAWEGAWSGLNVLKIVMGRVNGMRRCFAFTSNLNSNQLELYEIFSEANALQQGIFADNGVTPIVWMFETPVLFNKDVHSLTELIRLRDGELQVSNIVGTVTIAVYYKPDFYPCWTLWNQLTVCSNMSGTQPNATYHTRLGLGEPDGTVPAVNRPMRIGRFFQFRFVITGYCEINNFQASAITEPEPVFSPVNQSSNQTCTAINCSVTPDLQLYSLQGLPPQSQSTPEVFPFYNQAVYFPGDCASGTTLNYNGTLPPWITLDQINNQLVGAAGVFGGQTQAAANATAQAALNTFGAGQLGKENLQCLSCTFNQLLQPHTYGISGYVDGMLTPPSAPGCGGNPVWNGTFIYFGEALLPYEWSAGVAGDICISGYGSSSAALTVVGWNSCANNVITWQIIINNFGTWQKIGGVDPTGLYTFLSGPNPQPNLTIIQLS